jgi:hypothetical protein
MEDVIGGLLTNLTFVGGSFGYVRVDGRAMNAP